MTAMTPDEKEAIDLLGWQVVEEVFDRSCEYLQGVISHGMKGNKPDPLHQAYCSLNDESALILRRFLLEAVDQTFAQFLSFLEIHRIPLPVDLGPGKIVDLKGVSDGLAAEPYGEAGWIARFSNFKHGISPKDS